MTEPGRIVQRPQNAALQLPSQLHPLLAQVYRARGIGGLDELDTGLDKLLPPDGLTGIAQAAALLLRAINEGWPICIVGDYDCDGATSTALALDFLPRFGAAKVDFVVPNRFDYGYGLTPPIVEMVQALRSQLIITVDNGISSVAGIAAARAAGIHTLVTDHHLAGEQLPAADVIVNPNQPGDGFPSKHLAGVGVLFYVLLALRKLMRDEGSFSAGQEPNLAAGLDLVALGTVADVVPLDHNNRILVEQGLRRLRAGRARPGIAALLEAAGRPPQYLAASDLGFALGPRLNAAGRLDDMSIGIRCLAARSMDEARPLAAQLQQLNSERRELEGQMRDHALAMVEGHRGHGVTVFDESWHEGVVGLVASRVKDQLHRPSFAFAPAQEAGLLKGSGRSVSGFHIRDALVAIDARYPGLIAKFGGHAMAAGLSLRASRLDEFRQAFEQIAQAQLSADQLQRQYLVDGAPGHEQLVLEAALALEQGGPWGQGFAEPQFEGEFTVAGLRIVGERHAKYRLRTDDGRLLDAIHFGGADVSAGSGRITTVYRLVVNRFRDRQTAELQLQEVWPQSPLHAQQ